MPPVLDTLASYLPALVQRRLAADPRPITEPLAERFAAVVLFADVSGFTRLAEQLSQHGPEGVERLSGLLNTYFGQLIDLIRAHGGDVVKFAGDALLAVWRDASAPSALRAVQCALIAQETLQSFEATDERLTLRIGLGLGELNVEHLGGEYGLWEILVTGGVIGQASQAERQAAPGQVIAAAEVWAAVGQQCDGAAVSGGAWQITSMRNPPSLRPAESVALPDAADAALRAYVPGAILSRLVAGQTGWLAELRRVTVIFVHLPELDHATPPGQAQLAVRALQRALYRFEGSVDKLSVDEKGVSLIAAFGLPPLAHEDDPARGAQAALAMAAELRRMGWRCAIGVATGRAFCGSIGNDVRREYTMIGDVVNLAARLMQAAQAGDAAAAILCDGATHQGALREIDFEPLPAITVKGKAEPVAVFRPRAELRRNRAAAQAVRGPQSTLVGRTAERMLLADQVQNLLRGREGGVIVVEGEAGIGKSRLVDDLLEQAEDVGLESLAGGGDAIEQRTPYHAWRPIFAQLLGVDASSSSSSQSLLTFSRLGLTSDRLRLAPLLNAVLPWDLPDNEDTAQMTGEVRADNTRDLLLGILQAVAQRAPKLVVLEDAHWLDTASWTLAQLASEQISSILIVLSLRPFAAETPEEFTRLLASPRLKRLSLAALSQDDTLALVCQRLGVAAVPAPVAALIRDKAEGNPFYSEELAYALRDAGFIVIENGACRIADQAGDLRAVNLPDTVEGVITSRVDRLAPPQQLALKVASVIGRTFPLPTLRDVYPVEEDKHRLSDYLSALERLDLTAQEENTAAPTYIFKHLITREVVYNLMLFAQRRRLHHAVAEWHERVHAEDLPAYYELLAYHWRTAEEFGKAVDYLEKAGEQALSNYANDEAIEFYTQALALDPEKSNNRRNERRRAQWELRLGTAYANATRQGEARKHLEAGLGLLGQPPPASVAGAVLALLGQVLQQTLHRRRPERYVGRGAADRETLLEAARTYERLTEVYFFANDTVRALYAAIRSLNVAEAAGPSPELARAYGPVGTILGFIPLHNLADAYCRRALAMVEQFNDLPARAWVSLVTGVYYAGLGQWHKARGLFDEVVAVSERLGDRRRLDDGLTNLSTLAYCEGAFGLGADLAERMYVSSSRRNDADNQAWALQARAFCLLPLGRLDEAGQDADRLQVLFGEGSKIVDEPVKIGVYGAIALTRLRQGRAADALRAADDAAQLIARSSPTSYPALSGYASTAEVYLTLWESEVNSIGRDRQTPLRSAAQRACKGLQKYAGVFPIGGPSAWLWQGRLDWLSGNPRKAREAWLKSLALADKLAMPYALGQARAALARHGGGHEHHERAREIFTRLGARYDLARLDG